MNIISRFVLILGTIGVGTFVIFSTFMGDKGEIMEDLSFKEVKLGTFELTKDDENSFLIQDKLSENDINKERIFVEQVSNTSRFFTNNEISEVIVGRKGEESKINIEPHIYLNIKPGLYLFDLNEVNKNFVVDGGLFSVENKGPGSFIVNNINPSKTVIFALDTIINLNIKSKDETFTSVLLYPHSYIIFNQKRNFLVKNGDLLKVSSIFTLDFFGKKIFTENKDNLIDESFINIITIKKNEYTPFIINTLGFLKSELEERQENFQKYITKDFITIPGEQYIQKYFPLFINAEKQKVYYKNIILRNIITLFHETEESLKTIDFIKENIEILKQIDLEEAKKIEKIIYFYYINNLKIKNSGTITAINFGKLIRKIENNENEIPKGEALFFLKNIFKNYDFLESSSILEEISLFKEKYIGGELDYSKESTQYKEIEYLLFFLEKLLTTDFQHRDMYINQISVLLEDYTNISTQFYDSSDASIKKTGLFKNLIVLGKIENIIKTTYFKTERNDEGLLERKENNVINRISISRIEKSILNLNSFYGANKQFLDDTKNNDKITGQAYIKHNQIFTEFFEALQDYEKYKSKYNTEKSIFLGGDSINVDQKEDTTLSIEKASHYVQNFNGVSMNEIKIKVKNYDSCINPYNLSKSDDTQGYCYEVKNLDINGSSISFFLFPFENNKISEITLNNIEKNGSYKLDNIEVDLDEKLERVTKIEEKEKYDFKNFFLNTFILENPSETKEIYENFDEILQEDKIIKSFKRNKLLGDTGDFSILDGFLDIKYNNLIVEEDYSIFIKPSYFTLNVNSCRNDSCENNYTQYEGVLESEYIFTDAHIFKNAIVRIIDTNYKEVEKYILGGSEVEIIGDIKVNELKTEINTLLSYIPNLEESFKFLKNNLEINDIKIKYYIFSKRAKIESTYKNKKLDIYIESGNKINIYHDGKRIHENTLPISELINTLNTIK